jgi:hypothetical protein
MISITKTTMHLTGWILWLKARWGILSNADYGRVVMYYQMYHYSLAINILKTFFKYQRLNDYIARSMVECSQGEIARVYLMWLKEGRNNIPTSLFDYLIESENFPLLKEFINEIPLTIRQERDLIRMAYSYGGTFIDILKHYLSVNLEGKSLRSELNLRLMKQLREKYPTIV